MSVSGVSNSLSQTQAFQNLFKVNAVTGRSGGQDADGDNDVSSGGKVGKAGKSGGANLIDSLLKALQQMGASTSTTNASSGAASSTSTASTTSSDPAQALGDFLKSLMAAIQAEANKN